MTDTWETTVRTAATTMLRYPEKLSDGLEAELYALLEALDTTATAEQPEPRPAEADPARFSSSRGTDLTTARVPPERRSHRRTARGPAVRRRCEFLGAMNPRRADQVDLAQLPVGTVSIGLTREAE
jgi:hypothetical protein